MPENKNNPVGDQQLSSFKLSGKFRLRHAAEFQHVFSQKCSASDTQVIVYAAKSDLTHPRFGLSVSRKVGPAVVRNRWKRLIREAFRLLQHRIPDGVDLVIIPRRGVKPELTALMESLPQLATRLSRRLRSRTQSAQAKGTQSRKSQ